MIKYVVTDEISGESFKIVKRYSNFWIVVFPYMVGREIQKDIPPPQIHQVLIADLALN